LLKAITVRGFAFLVAVGVFAFFASSGKAQSCGGPPPSPQCILSSPSITGLANVSVCPSNITVKSAFNKVSASVTGCSFSCAMNTLDKAFTAIGCDIAAVGSPPTSETNELTATFHATDHTTYHYVGILTTVVSPNGNIATYPSPTAGTECRYP
jgi:hypothetical protein